eukprot:2160733-Pyramimonas_sp.AAC.1
MATSTTADTMITKAVLVATVTMTAARPMTAVVLITPMTIMVPTRRRYSFWKDFDMCARPSGTSGPRGVA